MCCNPGSAIVAVPRTIAVTEITLHKTRSRRTRSANITAVGATDVLPGGKIFLTPIMEKRDNKSHLRSKKQVSRFVSYTPKIPNPMPWTPDNDLPLCIGAALGQPNEEKTVCVRV